MKYIKEEENSNIKYRKRPGAYAIMTRNEDDKVGIVTDGRDLFYLGGGIEEGETKLQALKRELIEETGYTIKNIEPFDEVRSFIDGEEKGHLEVEAYVYIAEFDEKVASVDRMPEEARQAIIEKGEYTPSYMWNVNGWLCDKLGLTVISQCQKCVPQFNDYDIESSTLGMTVKAGMATGMSAVVTTETKEGITLETECIGKVYNKDEFDRNAWTVYGEPDTTLVIEKPDTVRLTCATVVNRIPDVIKAEPGFVPTSRMGELKTIVK